MYDVEIKEVYKCIASVQAKSESDAIRIVNCLYENGVLEIDNEDISDKEFSILNSDISKEMAAIEYCRKCNSQLSSEERFDEVMLNNSAIDALEKLLKIKELVRIDNMKQFYEIKKVVCNE